MHRKSDMLKSRSASQLGQLPKRPRQSRSSKYICPGTHACIARPCIKSLAPEPVSHATSVQQKSETSFSGICMHQFGSGYVPYVPSHELKVEEGACHGGMLRTLAESSSEFRRLSEHMVRTGAVPSRDRFGSSERAVQKALRVVRIERVLISDAETKYRDQRMKMFEHRGAFQSDLQDCCALRPAYDLDIGLHELLLYHGCRKGSIDGILSEGFDPSRSGERSGRFFGCGTYFADIAAKADTYVDSAADGMKCVVVAQVCLGKALKAFRAMPRFHPSCSEGDDERPAFDSVVGEDTEHGGILDHREYVIYDGAQAMPRYLVWYQHCEDCRCFRCRSSCAFRPPELPPLPPLPLPPPDISLRNAETTAPSARRACSARVGAANRVEMAPGAPGAPVFPQKFGLRSTRATSWERPRKPRKARKSCGLCK